MRKSLSPDDKSVQLGDAKTYSSARDIPLLDLLKPFLLKEKERQACLHMLLGGEFGGDGPVVVNAKGRPPVPDTITTEFKELVLRFDPKVVNHGGSFKSMRSGVASYLVWKKVPLVVVQMLLGHSEPTTLLKYYLKNVNDPGFEEVREAMRDGYVA